MTIAVDWDVKQQTKQKPKQNTIEVHQTVSLVLIEVIDYYYMDFSSLNFRVISLRQFI